MALLYICIIYRPRSSPEIISSSTRPLSFWQWSTYTQYIEFLAGLMYVSLWSFVDPSDNRSSLFQAILFLIFGRSHTFIGIQGFVALGLESTLPIPQLIRYTQLYLTKIAVSLTSCSSNYRQRSLYGFRMSTLIGWVAGDSFKCVSIVHPFLYSTLTCMKSGLYTFSYNNLRFSSKCVPSFRFPLTLVSTMSSS